MVYVMPDVVPLAVVQLNRSIGQMAAAIDTAGDSAELGGRRARRCHLYIERFWNTADVQNLGSAIDDFLALPEAVHGRAPMAAKLVESARWGGLLNKPKYVDRLSDIAAVGDELSPRPPWWVATRSQLRAHRLVVALWEGRAEVDIDAALAEVDELAAAASGVEPQSTAIEAVRVAMRVERDKRSGNLSARRETAQQLAALADRTEPGTAHEIYLRIMQEFTANQDQDMAPGSATWDRVAALRAQLPLDDPNTSSFDESVPTMRLLHRLSTESGTAVDRGAVVAEISTVIAGIAARAEEADRPISQRAMALVEQANVETAVAYATRDFSMLDAANRHLRAAVGLAPEDDPHRVVQLLTFGSSLIRRHDWTGDRGGLVEAIDALDRARTLAAGPAHPRWSLICQTLADAYHRAGRSGLGRDVARDGLRGHLCGVMLQSRAGAATEAAGRAAGEAVRVAREYLAAHDPVGAAAALDASRGLVLLAATQFSDVSARLELIGRHDLAARWRREIGDADPSVASFELRRAVVNVISSPDDGRRNRPSVASIDPPDIHEVRAALIRSDFDALVYLLEGMDGDVGAAVVLGREFEPGWVRLPGLVAGPSSVLARYGAEGSVRESRAMETRDIGRREHGGNSVLGELCRWAWTAAVGPLLEHVRSHCPPVGQPLRLVLIPMGSLARVPWHAACREDGVPGRPLRYAVQDAVFSYAVSARMFCDSALAPDVPLSTSGLVIGDPDTGGRACALPGARAEALAVQTDFYEDAVYLGRLADGTTASAGAGSRSEVSAWLSDPSPEAGSVLHATAPCGPL